MPPKIQSDGTLNAAKSRRQVEAWLSRAIILFVLSLAGLTVNWGWDTYQSYRRPEFDPEPSYAAFDESESPQRSITSQRRSRVRRMDDPLLDDLLFDGSEIVPAAFDVPLIADQPYDPSVDDSAVPVPPIEPLPSPRLAEDLPTPSELPKLQFDSPADRSRPPAPAFPAPKSREIPQAPPPPSADELPPIPQANVTTNKRQSRVWKPFAPEQRLPLRSASPESSQTSRRLPSGLTKRPPVLPASSRKPAALR